MTLHQTLVSGGFSYRSERYTQYLPYCLFFTKLVPFPIYQQTNTFQCVLVVSGNESFSTSDADGGHRGIGGEWLQRSNFLVPEHAA